VKKLREIFTIRDKISGEIDWNLRYNRMCHHIGSHIVFTAMKGVSGEEKLIYTGVYVGEKLCRININYDKPISNSQKLKLKGMQTT